MTDFSKLIPELGGWNRGYGASPVDWISVEGRADHALGFCSLLWPDILLFEGYVLRGPLDISRLRGWERAGLFEDQGPVGAPDSTVGLRQVGWR